MKTRFISSGPLDYVQFLVYVNVLWGIWEVVVMSVFWTSKGFEESDLVVMVTTGFTADS